MIHTPVIRRATRLRITGVENLTLLDDAELEAAALAADPDVTLPDDAVPFGVLTGTDTQAPLPSWYMPAPMRAPAVRGWRRILLRCNVALIIAAFVTINAAGLCNTYGQLHL